MNAATGATVRLFDGRYGPYVSDGTKVYASVPKGTDVSSLTLEQAIDLLAAKAAKGPTKRGRFGKKRAGASAKRTTSKRAAPSSRRARSTKKKA